MTKKEKLTELLQPYLDADIVTEIPDEVKHGVRDVLLDARDYDLYDEFIEELKNNPISENDPQKSYFEMLDLMDKYTPPLIIVDDDEYDEDEEDEEDEEDYYDEGDEEYEE